MTNNPLVLLVEDEALIRMVLEETLEDAGFGAVAMANGQKALGELEDEAERFHAVVTDIRLGPGANGWEVARRAREPLPDVPVVYVSGDSAHEWTARGVPNSIIVAD